MKERKGREEKGDKRREGREGKEEKGRKRLVPEGAKVGPGWRGRGPPYRDQACGI